ncbi:MAG: site-specific integrase [Propionibacteriaceae bacterium]|nr:site-specific integrase [Propionibacteriaceae bacterium]
MSTTDTAASLPPTPGSPTPSASASRRPFGTVQRQRSGHYQAVYKVKGKRYIAPVTFFTKGDANAWLSLRQAEILEHRWKPAPPPEPENVTFADYSSRWLVGRELSPKSLAEYHKMLNGRLAVLNTFTLDQITPSLIKAWWEDQGDKYPYARRRCYELLRAILATASRPDEDTDAPALLAANPARLSSKTLNRRRISIDSTSRGAQPRTRVQPATLQELAAIMDAMPERYRAMVLLAAWCAPRFGELTELRRRDLIITIGADGLPSSGMLHIVRAVTWPDPDTAIVKEPKTAAGVRDVAIPPHLLPMLLDHVDKWAAPGPNGLVFPSVESGGHMKHGALYKVYRRGRKVAGREDLRWHDLRHTGATMAAQAGATLAELMNRLGHSNVNAALIYQHAAAGRDAEIARRLSVMAAGVEGGRTL